MWIEYISVDNVKKYDLDTLDKKSEAYKRSWIIDCKTDTWLIYLGTGKENDGGEMVSLLQSKVYRICTESQDAKQDAINYNVRRKIIKLYDAKLNLVATGFDATEFLSALKAVIETRKAYGYGKYRVSK